jgi:hypothetical protein
MLLVSAAGSPTHLGRQRCTAVLPLCFHILVRYRVGLAVS